MKTIEAIKGELKAEQDKIAKHRTYGLNLFIIQSYIFNDRVQNFLIFQPFLNTFTKPTGLTETIVVWKSRELSNEQIWSSTTPNHSLFPKIKSHDSNVRVAELRLKKLG